MEVIELPYKAVLFDGDGTLYNSQPQSIATFQTFARIAGVKLPTERILGVMKSGKTLFGCCTEFFPEHCETDFERWMRENHEELIAQLELIRPFEGIIELMDILSKTKIIKSLVTNRSLNDSLIRILELIGMSDSFDHIVHVTERLRPKPEPDLYLHSLSLLALSRKDLLAVEDAPSGIEAAKLVGLDCCAVLWGNGTETDLRRSKPTYIASSIEELREIIFR